jgi:hypothetical protein
MSSSLTIFQFIQSTGREASTLEAAAFLAILANYHKSDAAKMNPYLKRIKDCADEQAMRNIRLATLSALNEAVR